MNEQYTRASFCPHCCNTAPQRLIHSYSFYPTWYSPDGSPVPEGQSPELTHFIFECLTCHDILLYTAIASDDIEDASLSYPSETDLHKSVPDDVRKCYGEAKRIQNIAPNAFSVMIRRALEAICEDRGVEKGNLHARLKKLADRGDLPNKLAKITNVLRELGNAGAHNTSQKVSIPMTWAMDNFFRVIVEYVYVAPAKLKEFTEKLEKLNAPS